MTKRRKKKTFSAVQAVKSAAREHVGTPPATRRAPTNRQRQRRKAEKHKPTLGTYLRED